MGNSGLRQKKIATFQDIKELNHVHFCINDDCINFLYVWSVGHIFK
jgi:hypothetical protein